MGTLFCCSNNSLCMSQSNSDKGEIEIRRTKSFDKKQITKKPTLFLEKSQFVLTKKKSLLDEYEIKERIGEGAFGSVFKAKSRKTKIMVAIKSLKKTNVDVNAFENEIQILKTLDHPNIIRIYECIDDNNHFHMITEYCSGGDLYDYIKRQSYFSEKKAASIMYQLLSAINHLHKNKIVHRDLKPENIVFVETEKDEIFIKIIDFGTSIKIKNDSLTQELGTVNI